MVSKLYNQIPNIYHYEQHPNPVGDSSLRQLRRYGYANNNSYSCYYR